MATNVGTVYATVRPDLTQFGPELTAGATSAANSFASSFSAGLSRAGRGFQTVGRSLTRFVTLPLIGIGAVSTKMALDFNESFSRMTVLAGDLGVSLEEAKQQTLDLAAKTGQDPNSLAQALYFTASAGLAASQVMPVLTASAQAAAIGMGDAQTNAQTLTSVLNAYAGTGLDAADAMNILTAAIKVGKAEPEELAQVIGQVIPVASQMGVSFDQVAAAISTATNVGIDAARASTGLRFLLASFQKPTASAVTALQDYGFTVTEIQRDLADPDIGLLGTLEELATKFDLSTTAGKAAFATVVGGQRGLSTASALIGKNLDAVTSAFEEVGAAGEEESTQFVDAFKKMNATPSQQLARAFAQLKVAAIELGNELIPILVKDIIPAVKDAVKWFQDLSPEAKKLGIELAGLAVVAGPILTLTGAILRFGGAVGKLLPLLLKWGKLPNGGIPAMPTGTPGGGIPGGGGGGLPAPPVPFWLGGGGTFWAGLSMTAGASMYDQRLDATTQRINEQWLATESLTGHIKLLQHGEESAAEAADLVNSALEDLGSTVRVTAEQLQFAADANVKLGSGIEAFDAATSKQARTLLDSAGAQRQYAKATEDVSTGNKKNTLTIAAAIGAYHSLIGPLKALTLQQVHNLLASGDQKDAIALLQREYDKAAKKIGDFDNAQDRHAREAFKASLSEQRMAAAMKASGDSATDAGGKVKDYTGEILKVPKGPITTQFKADTSAAIAAIRNLGSLIAGIANNVFIDIFGNFHTDHQEHGGFFPGAQGGGFVTSPRLIRVGEHSKDEMILPLEDSRGIAALTKALEKAGAGGGGRLHVIEGRVDLNTGAMRVIAREEENDAADFHHALRRMQPA